MNPDCVDLSIIHPWDPWNQGIGGFESCLDGFLRYAPASWRVELVGLTTNPRAYPVGQWAETSFAGRSVRFLPALEEVEPDRVRRVPLSLRFAIACGGRRVRANGQIVQFHRFESALGLIVPASAHKVFFLHNHPTEIRSPYSDVRWFWLSRLHDYLLMGQLRQAAAVVAVDPRTPAWVAAHLPGPHREVVHQSQWADPAIFHRARPELRTRERLDLRAELGLAPETKVALFAGRLELQKDPLLLLDAFALVHARRPGVFLAIVGKGRLAGLMKVKAADLGMGAHVLFLGSRSREQMPSLYRAADVLVCTSGFEAGPRTVFEALACGTPVLSVDVGQVREVLRSDPGIGRLVEPRTPQAIAGALEEMLEWSPSPSQEARCARAVAGFLPQAALAPVFDLYDRWLREQRLRAGGAVEA